MIMLDKEVMKALNYYSYIKVTLSLYMFNILGKTDDPTIKSTKRIDAVLNSLAWRSGLVESLAMLDHVFCSSLVHVIILPIDMVKRKLRQIIATVVTTVLARGMNLFHHHFTNLAYRRYNN